MRTATILALLAISLFRSLSGQTTYPFSIRQTIHGQVFIETAPIDPLLKLKNVTSTIDSTYFIKCVDYQSSSTSLLISGPPTYINNYLDSLSYSAEYRTNHRMSSLFNFPITMGREIRKVNNREYELIDLLGNAPAPLKTDASHIAILKYNRKGQLVLIQEQYLKYNTAGDNANFSWRYKYNRNKIKQISVDNINVIFEYGRTGKLVSVIHFIGKKIPETPYVSEDSLLSFYNRKAKPTEIQTLLSTSNFAVQQLVYFGYSSGKLTQILSYHAKAGIGIQKGTVAYDTLNRISSVIEDGLILAYNYDSVNNRLLKRKEIFDERCSSKPCPQWVTIDTYLYDDHGKVIQIDNESFQEYYERREKKRGYLRQGQGRHFVYKRQ